MTHKDEGEAKREDETTEETAKEEGESDKPYTNESKSKGVEQKIEENDTNKKKTIKCRYMERGYCRKSKDDCEFIHTVCKTLENTGYCRYGMKCWYVHKQMREDDVRSSIPCKFERQGRCYKGEKCEYRHERRAGVGQNTLPHSYPKQRPFYQSQGYEELRYQQQGYQQNERTFQENINFQKQQRYTIELLESLLKSMPRN